MRRRSQRHPVLETAVFAAALILAAFIARELWSRRSASRPPEPTGIQPIALNPGRPGPPVELETHRTEQAVTGVPAIKLSRVQPHKSKAAVVPPPR